MRFGKAGMSWRKTRGNWKESFRSRTEKWKETNDRLLREIREREKTERNLRGKGAGAERAVPFPGGSEYGRFGSS
jgi:hypothetical protein